VKPALPPSYVNTPVNNAYAEVDDGLIVTMTRVLACAGPMTMNERRPSHLSSWPS